MGSPTDAGSGSTEGGDVLGEKWMSGPVESPPTLDLDRTLSLAEGFIAEARRTDFEEEDPEVEPSLGEGMEGESPQDGGLIMEDSDSLIQGLGVEEGIFKDSMRESIRADGEAASRGKLVQEAPDFEAEFADLPDVGGGGDASGESLMLGGEPPEEPELGSDLPRQSLSDFRPQPDPSGDSGAEDSEKAHLPPPVGGKRSFPDRPRPMSKRRPPPKKGLSRWRMGAVAGALLVAVAAVGTGAGFFNIPGFGFLQGWFGEIPDPELALEGVAQTGPVLRFSLELDVYEEGDLGLALEMRNTLRQRLPSLLFDLTPRFSEGTVTYALYAGPAVDVVDAENLRVPLGTVLTREDPESWPVRVTPRAFWLGESGSLEEARTLLEAAEADGVLGYILQVTYPDGTEGFEVLSGAFQGVPDARGWQLTLREKGFRDAPLIERRGRPPE
jgi:hypothetical protein